MSLAIRNPKIFLALATLLAFAACGGTEESALPESSAMDLRVMTFNIEWGGDNVDFSKVVEAVRLSNADIVGIQEAEGNLQRLADELGWHYNIANYVISRFPLIEPPGSDGIYVLVELEPNRVVALANVHLPSDPSASERIRDGATIEEVLALERSTRLPKIEPYLGTLKSLAESGIPVFLTGDFNAPADTDWTDAMIGARPFMPYAVEWPVSRAVRAAGFQDSWRVVHEDPRTHPGLTWWAGRPSIPSYTPSENDAQDRIDFVWFSGPARVLSSEIVGESGGPEVAIAVTPWPSDHRGVVSTFSVSPAAMPPLVSTRRRINRLGDEVEIVSQGVDLSSIRFLKLDGESIPVTGSLNPGRYRVHAVTLDGVALEKDFWVVDPSVEPTIRIEGAVFAEGQAISITWNNAPGNRNDYVAAFRKDEPLTYKSVLAWSYINALPNGTLVLDQTTAEWSWPLSPGQYTIRLMKDDGYESLAESSEFEVQAKPGFQYFAVGNAQNVVTETRGLIVMQGGGDDVDYNYQRMGEYAGGGDFVVLRASGADEYNQYILDLCNCDSVETIVFENREAAYDDFVIEKIRNAEALFIAGGDQSRYVRFWKDSPVEDAIHAVAAKPAPIGGTSAGMAIMGQFTYSAMTESLTSDAALSDPFHADVWLETDFIKLPAMHNIITDQHLIERNRIGRTIALMARLLDDKSTSTARAIAADRETSVHVDPVSGAAEIFSVKEHETPYVYFLRTTREADVCKAGEPLSISGVEAYRATPGVKFNLRTWTGEGGIAYTLGVRDGVLESSRQEIY